jgi:hypothetical protein
MPRARRGAQTPKAVFEGRDGPNTEETSTSDKHGRASMMEDEATAVFSSEQLALRSTLAWKQLKTDDR